ncbi:MAG: peroxiredoxin-like family protein [Vicingaceae bacterium]|nr:peroxiredoxin-like family protein [Vicingaceae bacterium]
MKLTLVNTAIILLIMIGSGNIFGQGKNKEKKEPQGLAIGDTVANFTTIDADSNLYVFENMIKKGPIVVIFIRGQWCPICNRHMSQLQDSLQAVYKKGANVVVISPEKPEYINKTIEKTRAQFTILYDENQKISDAFDVTFEPSGKDKMIYNTVLGAKLKDAHTDDSERLPVPATFIIDTNKKIVWRHFDTNYKNRSTVKEILENIPEKKIKN